jgi:hypothetical protein
MKILSDKKHRQEKNIGGKLPLFFNHFGVSLSNLLDPVKKQSTAANMCHSVLKCFSDCPI